MIYTNTKKLRIFIKKCFQLDRHELNSYSGNVRRVPEKCPDEKCANHRFVKLDRIVGPNFLQL